MPDIQEYAREKASKPRGIARARSPMGWPQRGCTRRRRSTCRAGSGRRTTGGWTEAGQRPGGTAGCMWVWEGGQIGRGSVRRGGCGTLGRSSVSASASRRAMERAGHRCGPAGRPGADREPCRAPGGRAGCGWAQQRAPAAPRARAGPARSPSARGARFRPRGHATTTTWQLLPRRVGCAVAQNLASRFTRRLDKCTETHHSPNERGVTSL